MAAPQIKQTLLTIPQELRDLVYLHAIEERWTPPERAVRVVPQIASDEQSYSKSKAGKWQPLSLLLVNSQVRAEVRDVITQLYKSDGMRAELAIIAKGYMYTPKWVYLNFGLRPQSSLNLVVNLEILSTEAFQRNDGWPRQPGFMFRELLRMLNRFIYFGPSFMDEDPPFVTSGPFHINELTVTVAFNDWYTENTWPETVREMFRMLKSLTLVQECCKHIGQVHAVADYRVDGKDIRREQTWKLDMDICMEKNVDWNGNYGLCFGQTWLDNWNKDNPRAKSRT